MPLVPGSWYALQVRSQSEAVIARGLEQHGYRTFVPCVAAKRNWSDRTKTLQRPLFAGYVFCQFDSAIPYRMREQRGVMKIVSFGGVPMPVDERELESVRIVTQSESAAHPWHYLQEGTRARVCAGPLEGVEGLFVRERELNWIVIQITLLQRSVKVLIEGDTVRPIPS